MSTRIHVGHSKTASFESLLTEGLSQTRCRSIGLAVAYVSSYGAHSIKKLSRDVGLSQIRLITDIRDAVTHPQALRLALAEKWSVRVVNAERTFHPKLYVGGKRFDSSGAVLEPRTFLIGSSNLTRSGLNTNVECCLIRNSVSDLRNVGKVFASLWSFGVDLTKTILDEYEERFAARNRTRPVEDLAALGVSDLAGTESNTKPRGRPIPSMSSRVATVAWAGLQSSTGERRFQPEFPRRVGEMVQRMISAAGASATEFGAMCEDGVMRRMKYTYYDANSMYRLNVPNDVPGVDIARNEHRGAIKLEIIKDQVNPIRVKICLDEDDLRQLNERSQALATIGETSTRHYGWF
jgi:HKD family nuclease